jgi:hypothetical protein
VLSDQFKNLIQKYVKIENITCSKNHNNESNESNESNENNNIIFQMMSIIEKDIHAIDNTPCNTHKCYETSNDMYYFLYKPNMSNQESNIISLSRYFTTQHESIVHRGVLLKTSYDSNHKLINTNITLDDVVNIIRNKLVHKAIIIKTDNTFEEIIFDKIPIDHTNMHPDTTRYIQIDIFGKTLTMFIDIIPQNNNHNSDFNKHATIIGRKMKILGDVVVSLLSMQPTVEINNLSIDIVKKIISYRMHNSDTPKNISDQMNNAMSGAMSDNMNDNFYQLLQSSNDTLDEINDFVIPDDVLNGMSYNSILAQ